MQKHQFLTVTGNKVLGKYECICVCGEKRFLEKLSHLSWAKSCTVQWYEKYQVSGEDILTITEKNAYDLCRKMLRKDAARIMGIGRSRLEALLHSVHHKFLNAGLVKLRLCETLRPSKRTGRPTGRPRKKINDPSNS